MKVKPHLLVLTSRFPYPIEKGDKLRLFHQLRFLVKEFRITLLSLVENPSSSDVEHIKSIGIETINIPYHPPSYLKLGVTSLIKRRPIQTLFYFDKNIHNQITAHLDDLKPDVIYCQLVRMAPYVIESKIPKVVDLMDAMSLNMEKESGIRIPPISWIYKRESLLLKDYELNCIKHFDHSILISDRDRKHISGADSNQENVHIIENGVDTDYFYYQKSKEKYDFGFIGNMGYRPNVEAAKYIVTQVWEPYFQNNSVLIAGARPDTEVLSLANDKITISGWIEDIREAYHQCKIIIAPIFTGAGQQNKILEAMACGIPCVTTPSVNKSIGAVNKEHLLVASTPEEFKNAIDLLNLDEKLYTFISSNARNFVEHNYKWDVQVSKLVRVLKSAIK